MNLDLVPQSTVWRVVRLQPGLQDADRVRQLEEIGFLPGERVSVMSRGPIGGDPLAVRVGMSTFALRRDEARCIEVEAIHA